jgi:hypothetical protein
LKLKGRSKKLPFFRSTTFRTHDKMTAHDETVINARFTESHLCVMSSKKPQKVGKTIKPRLYESVTREDVCCCQIKQNKTKQNKTKQNKTKQNKTKQNKTKQNKTKHLK